MKKILNRHEAITDRRIKGVAQQNDARVFSKVRLKDVLPVDNSGISRSLYGFALRSHLDFLVTDLETRPLFAVEFDGPFHDTPKQQARDRKKNKLCERFELPLLRIKCSYLKPDFRGMDLLSWLLEVWFAGQAFYDAQERGQIPLDEPFIPWAVMGMPAYETEFPLWLSREPLLQIRKRCQEGACLDFAPSDRIAVDEEGNYRGIGFLRIDEESGVIATTGMQKQRFPIVLSDAIDEILIFEVVDALEGVLSGDKDPIPHAEMERQINKFVEFYNVVRSSHVAGSPGAIGVNLGAEAE